MFICHLLTKNPMCYVNVIKIEMLRRWSLWMSKECLFAIYLKKNPMCYVIKLAMLRRWSLWRADYGSRETLIPFTPESNEIQGLTKV